MVDTKEITPLLSAVETAEKITDPKEREQAIRDANMAVEKYLYSKSRISREFDQQAIEGLEGTGEEIDTVKNPLYRPFQSAFADPSQTEFNLTKGERPPEATIARGTTTAYIRTELAKQKAIRDLTDEKKGLDVDLAKYNAGQTEYTDGYTGLKWTQDNDPEVVKLKTKIDGMKYSIEYNTRGAEGKEIMGNYGAGYTAKTEKEKLEFRQKVVDQRKELKLLEEKLVARQTKLKDAVTKATTPVTEYKAGAVTISPEGYREEYRNTQVQMARSMEEQTDDEYAIMTNFFNANGGVPDSFTKEAFYQMKGIVRPVSVSLGGGHRFVSYGGESKIVTDVQSQGMSLADEQTMWKAGEFAKARNLNGVTANGFSFSGEVRVGDIDKANTVKQEIFTSTRALASVDRMLEIAENASLFDKLLPTEVSGIAQSLTNAAQSANRTEIGGSGAWSNQDQIYMDKVIRDPSSSFNAIFSTQAIASLKEYRARLLAGMVDKGTAYGFAFERSGNNGGLDSSMSQFRVRFNSALARNMTEQEALEYAKGTLYANGSE